MSTNGWPSDTTNNNLKAGGQTAWVMWDSNSETMLDHYYTFGVETDGAWEPQKDAISTALCFSDEGLGSAYCMHIKFVASDLDFKFYDDGRPKYEE